MAMFLTIAITCVSDSGDVSYVMSSGDGRVESGSVVIGWSVRPTTADFRPSSGATGAEPRAPKFPLGAPTGIFL